MSNITAIQCDGPNCGITEHHRGKPAVWLPNQKPDITVPSVGVRGPWHFCTVWCLIDWARSPQAPHR